MSDNVLISATVKSKIIESPTTVSLVLKLTDPKQKFHYVAGQFISLYVNINGKEIKRSYSLSSAPYEDSIQVSIKKVDKGCLSIFLVDQIAEGTVVKISPPKGRFFAWPQSTPKQYILFGAGSGVAPLFSIVKFLLHNNQKDKVIFVCSHKNKEEILFKTLLSQLAEKYSQRLQLIYTLSQSGEQETTCPQPNIALYSGRLSRKLMQNVFSQHLTPLWEKEFYICGPTEYMTEHIENLLFLGVPTKHLHIESFVSKIRKANDEDNPFKRLLNSSSENITEKKETADAGFLIGDNSAKQEKTKTILVDIDEQIHTLDYKEEKSILETILDAGIDAPYSCLSGACLSCLATVTEGCVKQQDLGILDASNINKKESLLCQAFPLSKSVSVRFD
ncbi:MAG: 2Fe-2S iron-sulfur cluster binding domain-containing protein [Bdellovibrionaceae bacterium]|nr:2Fe-2S iron-sulfur cluster binding domain-containing protein [Pseudobdellovibrionaceae bacterium]